MHCVAFQSRRHRVRQTCRPPCNHGRVSVIASIKSNIPEINTCCRSLLALQCRMLSQASYSPHFSLHQKRCCSIVVQLQHSWYTVFGSEDQPFQIMSANAELCLLQENARRTMSPCRRAPATTCIHFSQRVEDAALTFLTGHTHKEASPPFHILQ